LGKVGEREGLAARRDRRVRVCTLTGFVGQNAEASRGILEYIMRRLRRCILAVLTQDRSAVTALEYGLIAGLIAVVIITAIKTLGTNLSSTFNTISNHFSNGTVN